MKLKALAVCLIVPFLIASCGGGGSDDSSATPAGPFVCTTATPAGFRVVGYMPSWQGPVAEIDFASLTHINYAFALPNAAGELYMIDPPNDIPKLQDLVAQAHAAGVQVLIAVGGWMEGRSPSGTPFTTFAATDAGRQAFAQSVSNFVNTYGLDGADIDWEYPQANEQDNYTALIQAVYDRLHPAGKRLTAALGASAYGGGGVGTDSLVYFDWINIMAYDDVPAANHSPYSLAVAGLDYWTGRGVPVEKRVLGVPFYSRPGLHPYWWLVANYPDAPNHDLIGGEYYNGLNTIRQKTCLALQRGGGMMVWDLSDDTHDAATSLLTAIHGVVAD